MDVSGGVLKFVFRANYGLAKIFWLVPFTYQQNGVVAERKHWVVYCAGFTGIMLILRIVLFCGRKENYQFALVDQSLPLWINFNERILMVVTVVCSIILQIINRRKSQLLFVKYLKFHKEFLTKVEAIFSDKIVYTVLYSRFFLILLQHLLIFILNIISYRTHNHNLEWVCRFIVFVYLFYCCCTIVNVPAIGAFVLISFLKYLKNEINLKLHQIVNDDEATIDQQTNLINDLNKLAKGYEELFHISKQLNEQFQWQILMWLFLSFLDSITRSYFFCYAQSLWQFIYLALPLAEIFILFWTFDILLDCYKEVCWITGFYSLFKYRDVQVERAIHDLMMQIRMEEIKINICDLFTPNKNFYCAVVTSSVMYILLLIQFDMAKQL